MVRAYRSQSGDPDRQTVIRGTRLAVEFILHLLAAGQSEHEILANYLGVSHEDIFACLSSEYVGREGSE